MPGAKTAGSLSFQVGTYSGACSTGPSPSLGNQQRMLELEAFSHLGCPQEIKTNNGLGYITQTTQAFLEKWGIRHKTGCPYKPTGQAIVERAHQTIKTNNKEGVRKYPPGI